MAGLFCSHRPVFLLQKLQSPRSVPVLFGIACVFLFCSLACCLFRFLWCLLELTEVWCTASLLMEALCCLKKSHSFIANKESLRCAVFSLIQQWMRDVPAHTRKHMSYSGGIFRREGELCISWGVRVYSDVAVFDPGNWVYSTGIKLLMPEVRELGWNKETLGDICEAFLALSRLSDVPSARGLGRWLDIYVYSLYRFCLLAGDASWRIASLTDCDTIVSCFISGNPTSN